MRKNVPAKKSKPVKTPVGEYKSVAAQLFLSIPFHIRYGTPAKRKQYIEAVVKQFHKDYR